MTQETFEKYTLVIDEWFINGFNGTQAYLKFYPESSYESADGSFRNILEKTRISEYIEEKKKQAQLALQTSHAKLLEELRNWAYSDITETLMLEPEQVKELPEEIRRLITKYKHTKRHVRDSKGKITETIDTIELHFVSKEKAMEMIHKHTGFYEKDNEQKNAPIASIERVVMNYQDTDAD